jgi:predicted O-methyltransferase YrrM
MSRSPFASALAAAHEGEYAPPFSFLSAEEIYILCEKARATPPGCFVEVGVFKGGSAYHLADVAHAQGRELWLYDTFAGMASCDSAKGDTIPKGYHVADYHEVRAALGAYPHIIQAVFPHTDRLPPAPVAFAHIDCDQYHDIVASCRALEPLMASGGVIWFDDVPVLEGARRAVREMYAPTRIQCDQDSDRWYVTF